MGQASRSFYNQTYRDNSPCVGGDDDGHGGVHGDVHDGVHGDVHGVCLLA